LEFPNGRKTDKEWVMRVLKFRLEEFSRDPIRYENIAKKLLNTNENYISITSIEELPANPMQNSD
jgi:hypothetical protein